MTINKYIDWRGMYRDLVSKQLEEMPTAGAYKSELNGIIKDFSFVNRLYNWFLDTRHFELNSDEYNQYFTYRPKGNIIFHFSDLQDGGGCSYILQYSTELECFVDITFEDF